MDIRGFHEELDKFWTDDNIYYLWQMARNNEHMKKMRVGDDRYSFTLLDTGTDWKARVEGTGNYVDLNRLVEILTREFPITAFHQILPGKEPMYFVLSDNVPEPYHIFVAYHEVIESELHGVAESNIIDLSYHQSFDSKEERDEWMTEEMEDARRYPHEMACAAEIGAVLKRGMFFANGYAKWLVRINNDPDDPISYFNQAIPGFLYENGRISKPPLKVLIEFYSKTGFHRNVMEDFPWTKDFLSAD